MERSSPDGGEDDINNTTTDSDSTAYNFTTEETLSKPTSVGSLSTFDNNDQNFQKNFDNSLRSPKHVNYKHGKVGFSEIFGDVEPNLSQSYELTTINIDSLSKSFLLGTESLDDDHHDLSDQAADLSTPDIESKQTIASSDDAADWSDWDDANEPDAPNFSAVLSSLNSDKSTLEKNAKEKADRFEKSRRNVDINKGLGEEFDIQSIEVKKMPDEEDDFFADLAPNLGLKKFDLERMLQDADAEHQRTITSTKTVLEKLSELSSEFNDSTATTVNMSTQNPFTVSLTIDTTSSHVTSIVESLTDENLIVPDVSKGSVTNSSSTNNAGSFSDGLSISSVMAQFLSKDDTTDEQGWEDEEDEWVPEEGSEASPRATNLEEENMVLIGIKSSTEKIEDASPFSLNTDTLLQSQLRGENISEIFIENINESLVKSHNQENQLVDSKLCELSNVQVITSVEQFETIQNVLDISSLTMDDSTPCV